MKKIKLNKSRKTAISTVYVALENSSKILAKNIANNTVDIVQHKYGTEVGQVTDHALSAAGNTYLTGKIESKLSIS